MFPVCKDMRETFISGNVKQNIISALVFQSNIKYPCYNNCNIVRCKWSYCIKISVGVVPKYRNVHQSKLNILISILKGKITILEHCCNSVVY